MGIHCDHVQISNYLYLEKIISQSGADALSKTWILMCHYNHSLSVDATNQIKYQNLPNHWSMTIGYHDKNKTC